MELKPRPLTSEAPKVASEPMDHQKDLLNSSDGLDGLLTPKKRPKKQQVILKPRESSPNVFKHVGLRSSEGEDATFGPALQVYQRRKAWCVWNL